MSIREEARQEAERRYFPLDRPTMVSEQCAAMGFEDGAAWASEQADRERTKVPAFVAPAAEENALVEIVAEWLTGYMPTPYVPFSDRIGLARTILAAGFRKADREPSDAETILRDECNKADADMRKWVRVPVKHIRALLAAQGMLRG